ncbi:hypothetical protein J2X55_002413 [Microbacterium sp. 1154]|uniref:hypothetical protein n=1 Tax=Microbacterium sp. 1154 TaxID=2817733 RepID=UPI00285AB246|nr:hypothetical protein [Microbacterium sp. 1154]MDR6691490.1 hypothetical protein [Microbacterium sp. 1154]
MSNTEISWCAHGGVERSTPDAIAWVARNSLANQENLFIALAAAQADSGVDEALIAQRLGIGLDELKSAFAHPGDLSVDELRHFSIAAEIVISYKVRAAHLEYTTHHRALRKMADHARGRIDTSDDNDLDVGKTWRWGAAAKL